MADKYQQVKENFLSGKFKGCCAFFEDNKYFIEAGYCYLILDKLDKAQECFEIANKNDIRGHWGQLLIQMITGKISMVPTYFEVRNFLEADLDIFITYCKGDYVEKIIRYCDFLAVYNLECYKFIGRAFWSHNLRVPAMFFLNRAKDKLYNDPELHYLLAYIYYTDDKDMQKCKKELDTCLNILPEYAPAVALYKKLK
jgi:tetratricopeptide (TPR) repeat protein